MSINFLDSSESFLVTICTTGIIHICYLLHRVCLVFCLALWIHSPPAPALWEAHLSGLHQVGGTGRKLGSGESGTVVSIPLVPSQPGLRGWRHLHFSAEVCRPSASCSHSSLSWLQELFLPFPC